jgi:hypothetical protein
MLRFPPPLQQLGVSLGLFFITNCCANPSEEPSDLELYQQRIVGTPYILYAFRYPGHFVTSSDYQGWALLDSSTAFSRGRIDQLPTGRVLLLGPPAHDHVNLLAIDMRQVRPNDTLLQPVKHYTKQYGAIPVTVQEYHATYGQSPRLTGLQEYTFERLQETADSVCFYGVVPRRGSLLGPSIRCFGKGNIKVEASVSDTIRYLEIQQLVLKRDSVYKSDNPFALVANQPIVGEATYWFYPRKPLKANALTNWGIFQRSR